MAACVVLFSGVLLVAIEWKTTISFVDRCLTSILCGWIGMMIAVKTNVKTAHQCWTSQSGLGLGFGVAFQGGSVMTLSLASLVAPGIIALFILD